jgi:probable HAF family extracellular repeat protein
MQNLGTLGGTESEAYGVSADGSVVVGGARNAAGQYRAFRWTASGGMQDLGTLGGSGARLMVFPPTAPWWSAGLERRRAGRAFRWTASGGMQDLGTLGGSVSVALVFPPTAPWWSAGLTTPHWQGRAFRWTASGGMQDLGTLGGMRELGFWCFRRRRRGGRLGSQRRRAGSCLSLDGFWGDAGPRHAGRLLERGLWCFRRRRRGGRLGWQRRRAGSCLSLDGVGWHGRPEHDLCQPADQRLGAF